MLGVYDFCGHYEWTFEWLREEGGEPLVRAFWDEAICQDSQQHAAELIRSEGFEGMKKYWGHTLAEEGAAFSTTATDTLFRIDMHECPSMGFLLRNRLEQYHDYCNHCMGWMGPMMRRAGYVIDHEHDHCGHCWWEFRRADDPTPPSEPGELSKDQDVRLHPDWKAADTYRHATDPDDKITP